MNMNQRLLKIAAAAVIVLVPAVLLAASPENAKVISANPDDVFFLQELGALITQDGETIKIDFAAPADSRAAEYKSVDLESGDIIIMANGKKVKSVKDLRSRYDDMEIGEDVKFAVKRDKKMMIVAFPKADPENLPKAQMMMVQVDEDGESTVSATSESGTQVIKMEPGSAGNVTLIELGLLLGESEGTVIVTNLLPHASKFLGDSKIAEGDTVKSIQGKSVSALEEYSEIYESIPVGDTVRMVFLHDGKEISATIPRPDLQKNIMIKKQQ